jgi:hypothetical protein
VAEAEGVLALAVGLAHGRVDLRHGQAVDVGDLALDQLFARVSVERAGGGVGLHDPPRVRVDEELDGEVPLEDLAMDVLAASRAVYGFVHVRGTYQNLERWHSVLRFAVYRASGAGRVRRPTKRVRRAAPTRTARPESRFSGEAPFLLKCAVGAIDFRPLPEVIPHMKRPAAFLLVVVCALLPVTARAQAARLEVVRAAPEGEVNTAAEAAEVQVVFSEPMVVLGRVPATVSAPFFHITPARPGSFRWSGTRTLIFTAADPARLPYSTRYDVTIDARGHGGQRGGPGPALHVLLHHPHAAAPADDVVPA